MHHRRNRARPPLRAALLLILAIPACGGPSMTPRADRARGALEAALTAWREGKPPGNIAGTDPPVQAIDNEWTNGRKLAAFEVLRELPSESDRRFAVKLTHRAPDAAVEVAYVVLGSNPIAVIREEDFARTLNMDNNPVPKKKRTR